MHSVKHNWKIVNKVLKKDEEGLGPKIPPSIGIPSKVRHSAAGPRMADKEQCKCSAVYKLLHCCGRVAAAARSNSIAAPPRHSRPSHLISRLELRCIPIPGGITPNSTYLSKGPFLGQNYGGRVATRRAFWNRRGGKCDKKGCILGKPLLNSRAGIWTLSVSTLAWMVWGTFFQR